MGVGEDIRHSEPSMTSSRVAPEDSNQIYLSQQQTRRQRGCLMAIRLMDAQDFADLIGMTTWAVYKMVERGDGPPAIRIGSGPRPRLRFDPRDVQMWLSSKTTSRVA